MLMICVGQSVVAQETAAGATHPDSVMERPTAGSPAPNPVNFPVYRGFTPDSPIAEIRERRDYELLPGEDPHNELGTPLLKHFANDQKDFWTAPMRLHRSDLRWIAPAAGFTAALFASDSWIARQVPDKPDQLNRSQNISNYAVYSLIGATGGAFVLGHITHNDHLGETGLLSGEAALNSTAVAYLLNYATQRPRPTEGNGHGSFLQGGSSFPSEHATVAWSIASVVAHEYPGPLTKIAAYGLASAVTLTRITSKQHFASDAVIGSALGWYFGRQAFRAHHDPEVGGGSWGELNLLGETPPPRTQNMGSPYVPLDSWAYPAFERLAALGYLQSAYLGQRPWTRMECARLLEESSDRIRYGGEADASASQIYDALQEEFQDETRRLDGDNNLGASIDSVYTRVTTISGPPLHDSYNFGQTVVNDYGRPYGQGFNMVDGVTAHVVAGPFYVDMQGEYQHAPAVASYPTSVLQAVAAANQAQPLSNGTPTIDRFELLTGSVGFTVHDLQFSFGKQTLWLGPGEAGPLLFSNNAAPIPMVKVDNVSPFRLPLLSRWLGPVRTEFFVGQLSGHHWVFDNTFLAGPVIDPQPFIHGNKISFKPTPNLEFGMGLTVLFGGPGLPFTWHNFLRSYYSHRADITQNPGKRFSQFDFTYRIPGLRNWLTLYLDSMVVDEVSPIGSTRPSLNPGVYLPKIPRLNRLSLRLEGIDTAPNVSEFNPGFVYYDRRFKDGYTSDGNILGDAIGRAGRGGEAWATYSLSPRNQLQAWFRHVEADHGFLEGGHLNDFGVKAEFQLRRQVAVSTSVQYERWAFPLLDPLPQSNVVSSFQLTFRPHGGKQ